MIPGANLLNLALSVIGRQTVRYFANTGRTTNPQGVQVAAFAPGVDITVGSVQPMSTAAKQQNGLELEARAIWWYVPRNVLGLNRDLSGDQIEYDGYRWQVRTVTDWYGQDGWVGAACTRLAIVPPPPEGD